MLRLSVIIFTLLLPSLSAAFSTIEGDRLRWMINPTWSFGPLDVELPVADVRAAIEAAAATWSEISGASLALQEVEDAGKIVVSFMNPWPPEFGSHAAGLTVTTQFAGAFAHADTYLNGQAFRWTTIAEPGRMDVQGIATHELGHAIGLGHSFRHDATMYWSGGNALLRDLTADDERGARYLYGERGEGLLCDACVADADCAAGRCLTFEGDGSFCGAPCDQGCPVHSACVELPGGGESCAPDAGACSDRASVALEAGDYCFGGRQCPNGSFCQLGDDAARCVVERSAPFGALCQHDVECVDELCMPLDDDNAVCSAGCDLSAPECPLDAPCVDVMPGPQAQGACAPDETIIPEGGRCDDERGCQPDQSCLLDRQSEGRCRYVCEPYGSCPDGRGCSFVDEAEAWLCLSDFGAGVGARCEGGRCAGGLGCFASGEVERCVSLCDPASAEVTCEAPHGCVEVAEGRGICALGSAAFGEACEADLDCASALCLITDDGGRCGARCDETRACPQGWRCEDGACALAPDADAPDAGLEDVDVGYAMDADASVTVVEPASDDSGCDAAGLSARPMSWLWLALLVFSPRRRR